MLLRTSLAVAVLAFPFGTVYTAAACDVRALLNEGSHLMADQVVALEAHREEDPSDMSARADCWATTVRSLAATNRTFVFAGVRSYSG